MNKGSQLFLRPLEKTYSCKCSMLPQTLLYTTWEMYLTKKGFCLEFDKAPSFEKVHVSCIDLPYIKLAKLYDSSFSECFDLHHLIFKNCILMGQNNSNINHCDIRVTKMKFVRTKATFWCS